MGTLARRKRPAPTNLPSRQAQRQSARAGRHERLPDEGRHRARDRLHHRYHHSVSELPICLRVRHGNPEWRPSGAVEAHQPRALARRQAAGTRPAPDQDLRAVFVVARRQRSRAVVRAEETETEAVPSGAMLGRVVLQVPPQSRSEHVFRRHTRERAGRVRRLLELRAVLRVQDGAEPRPVRRYLHAVQIEPAELAKPGDENALAVLRDKASRVDHAEADVVSQLLFKRRPDCFKRAPTIMAEQVTNVFQQKGRGAMLRNDARHLEKQRPLRPAQEPVRAAERVLLRYAGDRERLAGKAGEQHIVLRDVVLAHGADVAGDRVAIAEIRPVGTLRVDVPLTRKNARAARGLKPQPHAADSSEEINECEPGRAHPAVTAARARTASAASRPVRMQSGIPMPLHAFPAKCSPGSVAICSRMRRSRFSWPTVYCAMARGQRAILTNAGSASMPMMRFRSSRASRTTCSSLFSRASPVMKHLNTDMFSGTRFGNFMPTHVQANRKRRSRAGTRNPNPLSGCFMSARR